MKIKPLFACFWEIAGAVNIRIKILGMALGLVLLLGTGITLQVRIALTKTVSSQLEKQSISVARDLAARSTDLILLNDLFSLHRLLQETQINNANVLYAFILDSNGRVIAHTFGDSFPLALIEKNSVSPQDHHHTVVLQTNDGLVWDTAVPILDGRAGIARIGLSDVLLRDSLRDMTGQLILTTALVSLIGVTVAALLTWILTHPILELVQATRQVAKGDFSYRVPRWANDEIGDLAEAFNLMTAELAHADDLRREKEVLRRQLLESVIRTQEEERQRISRELHDSTSQSLTSLKVGLHTLQTILTDGEAKKQTKDLYEITSQTLEDVHALAVQLRPATLDDLGLAAALQRFINDWQVRYHIPVDILVYLGNERLPGEVETALYRITQEAMTNIARHASAHKVSILLEKRGEEVVGVIEDDGQGFESHQFISGEHLGIIGMRERAELLGGKLTIESEIGKGTSLFVRIPLNHQRSSSQAISEGGQES